MRPKGRNAMTCKQQAEAACLRRGFGRQAKLKELGYGG